MCLPWFPHDSHVFFPWFPFFSGFPMIIRWKTPAWIASSASTEQWIFTGGSFKCAEMSVFLILSEITSETREKKGFHGKFSWFSWENCHDFHGKLSGISWEIAMNFMDNFMNLMGWVEGKIQVEPESSGKRECFAIIFLMNGGLGKSPWNMAGLTWKNHIGKRRKTHVGHLGF